MSICGIAWWRFPNMAYSLIQAGSSLQMVDASGVLTTLTLPTGITLKTDRPPRWSRFGRFVVLTNTPNRPIAVDEMGKVRVLVPYAPGTPHTLAGSNAGGLTGTYRTKQTYVMRDQFGNVISESDFGPGQATAVTVAAKTLTLSALGLSSDDVSGSNIYRTLDDGAVYFLWRELDGNTQTTVEDDDLADLALSIFTAPLLGTPPDLTLVAEWRGRLWGVGRTAIDDLRYTEAGTMYAWASGNVMTIPRVGSDTRGVTALIARREALVVGRRDVIKEITGTGNRDFRVVDVSDETGIESNESVAVWKEDIYFLGKDGVYKLGPSGVECLSDPGNVRSWFTTDTYFNRARFQYAFGYIDPIRLKYRLHLAHAGDSTENRWVEYDLQNGTWWGPHKTDAFTPVCGVVVSDASDRLLPMIGTTGGYLAKEQSTATDAVDSTTGIDFSVDSGFDPQGDPNTDKYWGRLSVLGKVQTAGTVQVTPYVGYLDAVAKLAINYSMTEGRQILDRLGIGALLKLNFRHTTAGEPVELYGYDIEDVHKLGTR